MRGRVQTDVTNSFTKWTPLRVTVGADDAAVPPGEMDLGALLLLFLSKDCREAGDDWGGDGVRERVRDNDPAAAPRDRDGEPDENGPPLGDVASSGGDLRQEFSSLR